MQTAGLPVSNRPSFIQASGYPRSPAFSVNCRNNTLQSIQPLTGEKPCRFRKCLERRIGPEKDLLDRFRRLHGPAVFLFLDAQARPRQKSATQCAELRNHCRQPDPGNPDIHRGLAEQFPL